MKYLLIFGFCKEGWCINSPYQMLVAGKFFFAWLFGDFAEFVNDDSVETAYFIIEFTKKPELWYIHKNNVYGLQLGFITFYLAKNKMYRAYEIIYE